jgi:DNA-directed RNA polymerase specialized sigma24 family protein
LTRSNRIGLLTIRACCRCSIDFSGYFPLDISVPADDQVTSLTGVGLTPTSAVPAFATTHWSVVLTAQGESAAAQEALGKLCRTYWRPIYSFVRRQGIGPADAEDLTQGFFASLLEHRNLNAVRKEQGRLRSYLLGALKYFVADERRRAMAMKRGKGQRLIPLEDIGGDERVEMEQAAPVTAELMYERRWASTVLERALNLLKQEFKRQATRRCLIRSSNCCQVSRTRRLRPTLLPNWA